MKTILGKLPCFESTLVFITFVNTVFGQSDNTENKANFHINEVVFVGNTIYAATIFHGVCVSTDDGNTWIPVIN